MKGDPVLPTGPTPCDLMIVGESPGREEVKRGEPFIGESGRILNGALMNAGIRRENIYITNVSKWYPEFPKAKFFDSNREQFRQLLTGEINLVKPKMILAIGGEAFHALWSRYPPISKVRGSWWRDPNGVPILPTLHPAWFMRGMMNKLPLFYWDIAKWSRGYAQHTGEIILP